MDSLLLILILLSLNIGLFLDLLCARKALKIIRRAVQAHDETPTLVWIDEVARVALGNKGPLKKGEV